ncbi:MAG: hypothetical protein QW763_06870 [Archaeoglobaceae archaeon]
MDERAKTIRNSVFYNFLIREAIYSIASYAEILKLKSDKEKEIDNVKEFLIGILGESRVSQEFSSVLDGLDQALSLTDIDKVLRVKDRIVAIIEFKHCKNGRIWIKRHTLETLQTIAKACNAKVLLVTKVRGKWFLKNATNDTVFRDYRVYDIKYFIEFDDKGLLEFLKKLVNRGGQQ